VNSLEKHTKPIVIDSSQSSLYKWNRTYGGLQRKYFTEEVVYRREQQIQDFIRLNDFQKVKFYTETDILKSVIQERGVDSNQDLTVIANQSFSRYPCQEIIRQISYHLSQCSNLYLCLVRWYINIDNSYCDPLLDDNFVYAIAQWLRKELPHAQVIDLSLNQQEDGTFFTWVVPDQHFFIQLKHEKNN
jgi:hypothetical protein